ncbi:MAG: HDOD domain-containing protein, partial [Nitrospinaceae bacterium]|nr:HDOD domain-containing protein [Nitrospinaceae bacterium]
MERVENFYERALDEIEAIPAISSVVFKILQITASEFSSRGDLLRCLSSDQTIAARVLQTINSAYYGMSKPISNLNVAVGLLGDKRIREIALLCSSSGTIRQSYPGYGISADNAWLHSVTTAFAAGFIAEKRYPEKSVSAFAAGLMHDIGKLVM